MVRLVLGRSGFGQTFLFGVPLPRHFLRKVQMILDLAVDFSCKVLILKGDMEVIWKQLFKALTRLAAELRLGGELPSSSVSILANRA